MTTNIEFDDLGYDDDQDDKGQASQSNPFNELRKQNRDLKKSVKTYESELEELRKFRQEYEASQRTAAASKVFSDLGLSEKSAKLFVKLNPDTDPTPEAVRAFGLDYGLLAEGEVKEEKPVEPFRPISVTGSNPTRGGQIKYEEYQTLLRENPTAAMQAVAEGRVEGLQSTPRD